MFLQIRDETSVGHETFGTERRNPEVQQRHPYGIIFFLPYLFDQCILEVNFYAGVLTIRSLFYVGICYSALAHIYFGVNLSRSPHRSAISKLAFSC